LFIGGYMGNIKFFRILFDLDRVKSVRRYYLWA
jgi:hypothetical protein